MQFKCHIYFRQWIVHSVGCSLSEVSLSVISDLLAGSPKSGFPNLCLMVWRGTDVITTVMKHTVNVMDLTHPETIPPTLVCRKIIFRETGPWYQKSWGPLKITFRRDFVGIGNTWFKNLSNAGRLCLSGVGGECGQKLWIVPQTERTFWPT